MGVITPTLIAAGSTTDIDIVFTAGGNMGGGKVSVTLPADWSAFSQTSGAAGYVTTSIDTDATPTAAVSGGNLVSGVLEVTIASLGAGESFTINYDNVVVPSQTGSYSFGLKSQASTSGSLVSLAANPGITVGAAADGSGTAVVTSVPTTVGPIDAGAVALVVPTGWNAPAVANTTVLSTGTIGDLSFELQTVTVDGVTLAAGQTVTFTLSGLTAQADSGSASFALQSKGAAAGTLTAADTASLTVSNVADGSGTLTVSPEAVISGSTQDITFTYTAAGSISSGGLQIIIPTGWSEPQVATPSGEGFINAYGGASNPASDLISMASVNGLVTIPVSLSA